MPTITCTNCNYLFEVDDHCFNSKDMVFNCDNCGTEISKNSTTQLWEAKPKEFIPKPEKTEFLEPEKSVEYEISISSKIKFIQKIVRICGYACCAFLISISFLAQGESILSILAYILGIIFAVFVINVLLSALIKHLETQEEIKDILKGSHNGSTQ